VDRRPLTLTLRVEFVGARPGGEAFVRLSGDAIDTPSSAIELAIDPADVAAWVAQLGKTIRLTESG
jgi:hypothetical protein